MRDFVLRSGIVFTAFGSCSATLVRALGHCGFDQPAYMLQRAAPHIG